MENTAVDVRPSSIGLGVFARQSFGAEDVIGLVTGQLIDDPEYEGSEYAIDMGASVSLEPFPPFRFLNHSCSPNCMLVMLEDDDGSPPEMAVEALRPIQPGEELSIDYGYPADSAIECRCGSQSCRGWIVAEEELAALRASLVAAADA